jgi:hypothetical protein
LEHSVQWANFWLVERDVTIINQDLPTIGALEPADHSQCGCLSTPRWTKQGEEFAGTYVEGNVVYYGAFAVGLA